MRTAATILSILRDRGRRGLPSVWALRRSCALAQEALASWLRSKVSRSVLRGAVGKVPNGNSLAAYSTARPVLNGGDGESGYPRPVPTQPVCHSTFADYWCQAVQEGRGCDCADLEDFASGQVHLPPAQWSGTAIAAIRWPALCRWGAAEYEPAAEGCGVTIAPTRCWAAGLRAGVDFLHFLGVWGRAEEHGTSLLSAMNFI